MQKYVQSGQPERQVQAEFLKFSGSYPQNTQNNWAGRLKSMGNISYQTKQQDISTHCPDASRGLCMSVASVGNDWENTGASRKAPGHP